MPETFLVLLANDLKEEKLMSPPLTSQRPTGTRLAPAKLLFHANPSSLNKKQSLLLFVSARTTLVRALWGLVLLQEQQHSFK